MNLPDEFLRRLGVPAARPGPAERALPALGQLHQQAALAEEVGAVGALAVVVGLDRVWVLQHLE